MGTFYLCNPQCIPEIHWIPRYQSKFIYIPLSCTDLVRGKLLKNIKISSIFQCLFRRSRIFLASREKKLIIEIYSFPGLNFEIIAFHSLWVILLSYRGQLYMLINWHEILVLLKFSFIFYFKFKYFLNIKFWVDESQSFD